jgi:hypothetical protein
VYIGFGWGKLSEKKKNTWNPSSRWQDNIEMDFQNFF